LKNINKKENKKLEIFHFIWTLSHQKEYVRIGKYIFLSSPKQNLKKSFCMIARLYLRFKETGSKVNVCTRLRKFTNTNTLQPNTLHPICSASKTWGRSQHSQE
jgi:hypothetical protein